MAPAECLARVVSRRSTTASSVSGLAAEGRQLQVEWSQWAEVQAVVGPPLRPWHAGFGRSRGGAERLVELLQGGRSSSSTSAINLVILTGVSHKGGTLGKRSRREMDATRRAPLFVSRRPSRRSPPDEMWAVREPACSCCRSPFG